MNAIISVVMTLGEAQEWDANVGRVGNQLRALLYDGYNREAWRVLGYANWTACLSALAEKHGFTERRLWQLHQANEIQARVTEPGSVGEIIPERRLRPLTRLSPADQVAAWQVAVETAPNGKVTAAHVAAAVERMRRQERDAQRAARVAENSARIAAGPGLDVVTGFFSTIVVDPPWDWGDEGDHNQFGRARPVYATMPIDELRTLPISRLADDDAHLYLWITNRSLPKGFTLLDAWGFRYITCLTWVKPHFGMGNYYRGQTEHVLFGVRGSLPLLRRNAGTVFSAARGPDGHSSKPDAFYDLVESCSPGPYLDIFGRRPRNKWLIWGENGLSE